MPAKETITPSSMLPFPRPMLLLMCRKSCRASLAEHRMRAQRHGQAHDSATRPMDEDRVEERTPGAQHDSAEQQQALAAQHGSVAQQHCTGDQHGAPKRHCAGDQQCSSKHPQQGSQQSSTAVQPDRQDQILIHGIPGVGGGLTHPQQGLPGWTLSGTIPMGALPAWFRHDGELHQPVQGGLSPWNKVLMHLHGVCSLVLDACLARAHSVCLLLVCAQQFCAHQFFLIILRRIQDGTRQAKLVLYVPCRKSSPWPYS